MSFNHSLSAYHLPKVRELLKNAVAVGCSVGLGPRKDRGGICIGFGEKYIPRNGHDQKHAGVYIDYTIAIVKPSDGGPHVLVPINLGSLAEIADICIKIGDLPETPFWEGDTVVFTHDQNRGCGKEAHWVITKIGYDSLTEESGWSNKKILASCVLRSCENARTAVTHDMGNLTLVEHGNLWKMKHGEQMKFTNLEEEAKFYQSLGMSRNIGGMQSEMGPEGIMNSRTGNFEFRVGEALDFIHRGRADEMKLKDKKEMLYTVIKYDNEEFGKRMREHTLKKFGVFEEVETQA